MKKTNALRSLDKRKISYETLEYQYDPNNLSVDKIAEANKLKVEEVYKTLVAKGDRTGPLVAVLPGDESLDLKALAVASKNKKITLVPVKELLRLTGYVRGGCSPLGMKKRFPAYISESVKNIDTVYLNAGTRGLFVKLAPADLIAATKGNVCPIGTKEE